ncbi:hypothetical protein HK405_010242, partial [Cladochytrium tenue]
TNTTLAPDADPLDACSASAHGTHVAGIIAANATGGAAAGLQGDFEPAFPFAGVAPGVTLGAYRIYGCATGFTETDVIAAALYAAAEDGADIINLSLGSGPGYGESADAIAATRVTAAGHVVVGASGNDGVQGLFATAEPGAAPSAIDVASVDNFEYPFLPVYVGGTAFPYDAGEYNDSFGVQQALDVFVNNPDAVRDGVIDDGCTSVGAGAVGKTALIRWGVGCGSSVRCDNAYKAGAVACLIYSNVNESIVNIVGSKSIPSASTSGSFGVAHLASPASPVVISNVTTLFNVTTAGRVSEFSSPGPDAELRLRPDVAGVGKFVYSTVSPYAGALQGTGGVAYAVYAGTSMATPFVAGCVALLLQARGRGIGVEAVRAFLQNNASPTMVDGGTLLQSVAYQGAGMVQVQRAATAQTLVTPSFLELNDTVRAAATHTLTVTNLAATAAATYAVSHVGAAMVGAVVAGDDAVQATAVSTFTADYARVSIGGGAYGATFRLEVPAGASREVTMTFAAPAAANASLFPVFSGYLVVSRTGADGHTVEQQQVPYMGMVGDWNAAPVLSMHSASFGRASGFYDAAGAVVPTAGDGVFNVSAAGGGVYVFAAFATPTRHAVCEVVFEDAATAAVSITGSTNGTAVAVVAGIGVFSGAFARSATVAGGESLVVPTAQAWAGTVVGADGATIQVPAGRYRLRLRAQRHFAGWTAASQEQQAAASSATAATTGGCAVKGSVGNSGVENDETIGSVEQGALGDYEVVESPTFTVVY